MQRRTALGAVIGAGAALVAGGRPRTLRLNVKCAPANDLWRVLKASGVSASRFDTAEEAIGRAARESSVLVLADGYPRAPERVSPKLFEQAADKELRVYFEFPAAVPGISVAAPRRTGKERAVVASNAFGAPLPPLTILGIHDCTFVPSAAARPDIVVARVAGFDKAVFGLPDHDVFPILFSNGNLMVATTKLSQFVTGRYAPAAAWESIWGHILEWAGVGAPLRWTPAVRPTYTASDKLAPNAELEAVARNVDWYVRSRMLIHPDWAHKLDENASRPDRVGPAPSLLWPSGDGSNGLLEGFSSSIQYDGSQPVRWWLRADCMGEATFPLALAGRASFDSRAVASNLNDFVYFKSVLQQGARADPSNPGFGLLGWNTAAKYSGNLDGFDIYYGDDNARAMLGTLGASAVLNDSRWDEAVARCLLANYRTSGKYGFRGKRLEQRQLAEHGWKYYFNADTVDYAPHYEAYLWALYLWAYGHSDYQPFFDRAMTAIQMTMRAYPSQWRWTNGLQQERARMLLPLAWLIRVQDTREHREWLSRVTRDMLAAQEETGAIREELGPAGRGDYGPPRSNEQYGSAEATLIQENGDPIADLVYTTNFAFLGLHEAAAATGDQTYRAAEDRLAQLLCRVQVRSEFHPELDGGWFRAFDFRDWAYWASNADTGWGAWTLETGWTQPWINSVLQLRQIKTSYWQLTQSSKIRSKLEHLIPQMLN